MMPHPDKKAVEAQQVMANFVNVGGSQRDFVSLMAKEHRYLQGGFTRLCIQWIERAAEQYTDGDYDLRNESECQKAYQMVSSQKQEVGL